MADYKILDMSGWNINVPYEKLPSLGIKGVILRITEKGNKTDSMFEKHWQGCQNASLALGVYKYSYAKNMDEMKTEANTVVKVLNGRKCPLGVWLDVEDKSQITLSKDLLKKMIEAFRKIITEAGYHFGVYTGKWVWSIIGGKETGYDYWIASYPNNDTGVIVERVRPNIGEVGWQYSSKYKLNGGDTDISTFNKKYIDELLNGVVGFTSEGDLASEAVEKKSSISKVESATSFMENIARDDSHGYSQDNRWGPDYDCSSLTIYAWEQAGVPVKTKGATYTGNMYPVFTKCGFKDVTKTVNLSTGAGLIRGDVLLNAAHHVAVYCGNGLEVEASVNEKGGAHGGKYGDQTGREILIRAYRNYPWNYVLRYPSNEMTTATTSSTPSTKIYSTVKKGSAGILVVELQSKLRVLGYNIEADGDFGTKTQVAVVDFQKKNGLVPDGIVGNLTWTQLNSMVDSAKKPSTSLNKNPKYTGKVTASQLNVRTGAGTNYELLPSYPRLNHGNLVDVCDEVNSGNGKWYYIRIAGKYYGYVSASYITRA